MNKHCRFAHAHFKIKKEIKARSRNNGEKVKDFIINFYIPMLQKTFCHIRHVVNFKRDEYPAKNC